MTSVAIIHVDTQRWLRRVAVDTSFRLVFALTKTTNFLMVCAVCSMTAMMSAPVRLLKVKRADTSSRRSSIAGIGLLGIKLMRWRTGKSKSLFITQTLLSACLWGVSGAKGFPPSKSQPGFNLRNLVPFSAYPRDVTPFSGHRLVLRGSSFFLFQNFFLFCPCFELKMGWGSAAHQKAKRTIAHLQRQETSLTAMHERCHSSLHCTGVPDWWKVRKKGHCGSRIQCVNSNSFPKAIIDSHAVAIAMW